MQAARFAPTASEKGLANRNHGKGVKARVTEPLLSRERVTGLKGNQTPAY
jgi:hypothetical protein